MDKKSDHNEINETHQNILINLIKTILAFQHVQENGTQKGYQHLSSYLLQELKKISESMQYDILQQ